MQVKDLMALLTKADPEAEVVVADYLGEYFAGVEEATTTPVHPWDGEGYTEAEPAFVLRQTHESVAATTEFTPD